MKRQLFLLFMLIFLSATAFSQPLEPRVQHLLSELRCLVCQNQDLLDSHAPLALDLKSRVYELIEQGQSDDEIKHYLVTRYGDFILFKPPVKAATWVLWFGPGVFLAMGLFGMIYWVKRRVAI